MMTEPMATDETLDGPKPSPSNDLVDEFETAFQKCLTVFEKPEAVERMTGEEMRSAVDNNIMRFIELGRSLEAFFLTKRFLISQTQPEQILREDITELKIEIQRKDQLIQRHSEKVASWQNLLNAPMQNPLQSPGLPASSSSSAGGGSGHQGGVPHGGLVAGAGGVPQQMRMMSPGAPQHARMPGSGPGGVSMMQPPPIGAGVGHLASLERSASNAGIS